MLVMSLYQDEMGLVERGHGSTAGIVEKTVSRTMLMLRRASDNALGILEDPNDTQVLPGSDAKMESRENALTLS